MIIIKVWQFGPAINLMIISDANIFPNDGWHEDSELPQFMRFARNHCVSLTEHFTGNLCSFVRVFHWRVC